MSTNEWDQWSADEDSRLRQMWLVDMIPIKDMSEQLGRSDKSIYRRITRLGLPKREVRGAWKEEEIEQLRKFWAIKWMSTAVMADKIGKSKGSICGMARRLGLPIKKPPAKRTPSTLPRQPRIKREPTAPNPGPADLTVVDTLVEPQKPSGGGVPLLEASAYHCRAIIDVKALLICGEPVVEGKAWCPYHLSRFTVPRIPRR